MPRAPLMQAIYRPTGVIAYDGNPLIEALPPIHSTADIASMIDDPRLVKILYPAFSQVRQAAVDVGLERGEFLKLERALHLPVA